MDYSPSQWSSHWIPYKSWWIPGRPAATGRPRTVNRFPGGSRRLKPRTYTPKSDLCKEWQNDIYVSSLEHKPSAPFTYAVRIDIVWFMDRLKYMMHPKYPSGPIPMVGRPDRDNLDKTMLDTLGKMEGWFKDDCQVTAGYIEKMYAPMDHPSGSWIAMYTWSWLNADLSDLFSTSK